MRAASGYFSGWNEEKQAYDPESWLYQGEGLSHPKRDLSLQNPRCVFQTLKRHFARYTPEMVEKSAAFRRRSSRKWRTP